MMLRTAGTALIATLALGAAGPDTALADRAPTTITLHQVVDAGSGRGEYSGRVRSPRPRCRRHRPIELIHAAEPPTTIGETESDEHGKWKLTAVLPADGETVIVHALRTKRCKGTWESYQIRR